MSGTCKKLNIYLEKKGTCIYKYINTWTLRLLHQIGQVDRFGEKITYFKVKGGA